MKKILFVSAIVVSFCLAACGSGSPNNSLSNPPAGFVFTNENGTVITSIESGDGVQLRNEAGTLLIQFLTNGNIDFTNVVAGLTDTLMLIHFPSDGDKSGLTGTALLFVPCTTASTEVHICPQATVLADVAAGCASETVLTEAAPASGDYTWVNEQPSERAATEACQVTVPVGDLSTGGFSVAS